MTVPDGWTIVRERRFYHVGGLTRDDGETGLRIVIVDNLAGVTAPSGQARSTGAPPSTIS